MVGNSTKMKKQLFNSVLSVAIFLGFMTPSFSWAAASANDNSPFMTSVTSAVTELGRSVDIPSVGSTLGNNKKVCSKPEVSEFFPIGDSSGKSVLTRKDYVRECETTKTEQGKCIQWEERRTKHDLTIEDYNTYETANFGDSIGSLLAALGGYDQIGHIWSGWHGYCEHGTKADFNWAKDPMFWGMFALSFLMDATAQGTVEQVQTGTTTITTEVITESGTKVITETVPTYTPQVIGRGFMADTAMGQGMNNAFNSMGGAAGRLTSEWVSKEVANGLGRCLVGAAAGMLSNTYDYLHDDKNSGGLGCDPVDEVCHDDGTIGTSHANSEDVMTMDSTQFYEVIEKFKKGNKDVNPYDYIEKLKEENGIVTFRFRSSHEIPGMAEAAKESAEKQKEMMEQMKNMQFALSSAMTLAKGASCIASATGTVPSYNTGSPGSSSGGGQKGTQYTRMGFGAMLSILNTMGYLGPYGAIIAAVLKLAMQIATSYQKIDACNNKEDAQQQGVRQFKTYKSLQFNLCHHIKQECAQKDFFLSMFGKKCSLTGEYYCCYDQILTKVLVVQLKAQLGRGYGHCTGITLRDLNFVSLRQCSASEKNNGFDGASESNVQKDMKGSYQFKNKCVNLEEFMYYLQSTIGQDLSMDDFSNFWNELSKQALESGVKDPTLYNSEAPVSPPAPSPAPGANP
ncbi:hypothetical protein ACPF04_06390 [Campylobacter sp. MOP51]|uniref:hypothetical protein n=1 Tax=Campylobacter canis TaxID=3378588 RepID=UPI003C32B63B